MRRRWDQGWTYTREPQDEVANENKGEADFQLLDWKHIGDWSQAARMISCPVLYILNGRLIEYIDPFAMIDLLSPVQ